MGKCGKDTGVLGILNLECVYHMVCTFISGDSSFEHDLQTWLPPTSCPCHMEQLSETLQLTAPGEILAGSPSIANHMSEPGWHWA